MRKIALIAAAIGLCVGFLAGCGADAGPYTTDKTLDGSERHVLDDMKYAKDKYGVCYAMYHVGTEYGMMTSVPCEKVGL